MSKMQRHKVVVRIILLVLSVINFVLAAPVLEHGIRVDLVDVGKDVITASQRRWNSLDKWWTNAAPADRTNTPQSLGSSGFDYRLEQELRPHDPRSPVDSDTSPQPSLGSTDPDSSHPLPVGQALRLPASINLPLAAGIDLNAPPQPEPGQEPIDGPDPGTHLTSPPTHSNSYSSSHDSNPPLQHGNLDLLNEFNNRHPPPGPEQLAMWSDPIGDWPYSPSDSGLRPQSYPEPPRRPQRPHSPSVSEQSTGSYPSPDPSKSHSPSPGPLQQESENVFSELLRGGRYKRHISGSRSVNAAQRGLQGTLDYKEYVSGSAFPLVTNILILNFSVQRLRALTKFLMPLPLRLPQYRDVASSHVLKARSHRVS
jgi:hypothetical protein